MTGTNFSLNYDVMYNRTKSCLQSVLINNTITAGSNVSNNLWYWGLDPHIINPPVFIQGNLLNVSTSLSTNNNWGQWVALCTNRALVVDGTNTLYYFGK